METFLKILCIAAGGSLGASSRHLLVEFFETLAGLPTFGAVMIVNVFGCFLIGVTFVYIEGVYRRDGKSRLRHLPVSKRLEDCVWWPDGDATLPSVDMFRFNQAAEMMAAFFITGTLGAMTTFSLYSLITLQCLQAGDVGSAVFNAIGTVVLGFLAVPVGFQVGHRMVPRANRESP
ncbi:MAG: CrcB family protein [Deltaproteobacteria bacterium]|nr:CrcB family protein [Deltaproteobacteria bacterium]